MIHFRESFVYPNKFQDFALCVAGGKYVIDERIKALIAGFFIY